MKIGHGVKSRFKKYIPEALLSPDGKKGSVKFCFIENDENELLRARNEFHDVFDANEIVRIGNINANKIITEIKEKITLKKKLSETEEDINFWRDEKLHFADYITNTGLAANRQLGRVALADGFDKIYQKINEFQQSLSNPSNPDRNGDGVRQLTVYIISGTCGGTGSSMFFDVSAMIDLSLGSDALPKKVAFLLNTNNFLKQKIESGQYTTESQEYKNLQINSWAFIHECEFFLKKHFSDQSLMGKYTARKSRHTTRVKENRPYVPFSNAYLFDIFCSNGGTIPLSTFYQTVSEMVFYSISSASMERMESEFYTNKFIDNEAKAEHVDYNTIAYKTIKFPQEEFADYFETRFLYEIFKYGFLNKEINSNKVQEKAKQFVDGAFLDETTGVFVEPIGKLRESYASDLDALNSYTSLEQYRQTGNKLINIQEFSNLFSAHQEFIGSVKGKIENFTSKIGSFGFDKPYYTRGNVADKLRKSLWDQSHEVIMDFGYYGLLGLNEGNMVVKGFLTEVYEILKQLFVDITVFKNGFDEPQLLNNIETARTAVLHKLDKGWGKKSMSDIQNELNIYHETVRHYFEQVEEYFFSKIKQEILYQFALGDNKENLKDSFFGQTLKTTELRSYRQSVSVGFGTSRELSDDTSSLIWAFSKDNEKDRRVKTIRNKYMLFIPEEWEKTRNDLFTVYLPNDLSSYLSSDSSERWNKHTVLSDTFEKHVTTGAAGLKMIFGDDVPQMNYLLSRLGEVRENINEDIRKIQEKIRRKFVELYTGNSDSEVFKFINRNIQEAYLACDDTTQEKIKQSVGSLVYPLRDVTRTRTLIPMINIHSTLSTFAVEKFGFTENRVISYSNMPVNQMVLIGIATDFEYEKITDNKTHKIVFESRDPLKYRPFLHNEWNSYITGPYEAFKDTSVETDTGVRYVLSEAFLLSLFVELLSTHVQKAGDLIYLTDNNALTMLNGKRSAPITINNKSGGFSFYVNGETREEKGKIKFFVKSGSKNREVNLGKLYDTLGFTEAFKLIGSEPDFESTFKDFHYVIEENKDALGKVLTAKIRKEIKVGIVEIQNKLNSQLKNSRRKRDIKDSDVDFIENFSAKMIMLVKDLLNVDLG